MRVFTKKKKGKSNIGYDRYKILPDDEKQKVVECKKILQNEKKVLRYN